VAWQHTTVTKWSNLDTCQLLLIFDEATSLKHVLLNDDLFGIANPYDCTSIIDRQSEIQSAKKLKLKHVLLVLNTTFLSCAVFN
jgi:hypothetical protein